MKAQYNKSTQVRETVKGRRLHADISGILPLSVRGFQYFLLVCDDATRTVWVRKPLIEKLMSEVLPYLKDVKAHIKTEIGTLVVY